MESRVTAIHPTSRRAANESSVPSLATAKAPLGTGVQPILGMLWALGLIGLGGVGVRDALVYAGAIDGKPWLEQLAGHLNDREPHDWMIPAGVAVAMVGLFLIVVALRPRPRKGIALTAHTGVYLSSGSVQRVSKSVASQVDGVDTTSVSASRRSVKITATTFSDSPEATRAEIERVVTDRLSALEQPPVVRVRVTRAEGLR